MHSQVQRMWRLANRSSSLELRFLLCDKCGISTPEILRLHTQSLRLGFGVDGLIQAQHPFLVETARKNLIIGPD